MSNTYGYARVSTVHQDFSIQVEKIKEWGVIEENIYSDKSTGKNVVRPGLQEVLGLLQKGDKLVIYKLDRFARNTKELLIMVDDLIAKGVGLVVLDMHGQEVDTSTPMGRFFITVLGAVSELERNMILERTKGGIEQAKKNGVKFGRKQVNKKDYETAIEFYISGNYTVKEVMNKFSNLSEATFYRRLKERREKDLVKE